MAQDLYGLCPFATTQRLIQGKWAILIMHHVSNGPIRFNELLRKMPKMTHATLSNQLKQLEDEGLIERKEYAQIPPKVEYSLTDIGRKFDVVLNGIQEFGIEYISYLNQSQISDVPAAQSDNQ